jgi:hypothetical protein
MTSIFSIYFIIALIIFLLALLGAATYYILQNRQCRKYPYGKWETLMKRLAAVDRENIALVAREFGDENGRRRIDENDLNLDPSQILPLVGEMKGLEVLERNSRVLVDLVFYAQQWYPEVLLVTEQLRQHAREVEFHIDRLRRAEKNGHSAPWYPEYARRAVVSYYVMTRKVLDLYERMNLPGLAELQKTL